MSSPKTLCPVRNEIGLSQTIGYIDTSKTTCILSNYNESSQFWCSHEIHLTSNNDCVELWIDKSTKTPSYAYTISREKVVALLMEHLSNEKFDEIMKLTGWENPLPNLS